jgi:carbamoylphosphate synthase large subunit
MWRANWTLVDDATRFQPTPPSAENQLRVEGANLDEQVFFRVERQTVRKMPRTGDVIFTIRTYVTPLGKLLQAIETPKDMLEALKTMDEDHVEYKGWNTLKPALLAHLERDI